MEGMKSHNLPSVSWRTRKASGVIQSENRGLRTMGADDVSPSPKALESGADDVSPSLSLKAWEARAPKSERRRRWMSLPALPFFEDLPFSSFSVLFRPSEDWMMPTWIGEGGSPFLSLLIQMLISSTNTLTDTPRNNVYYLFGASLVQSSWHIKLTIIVSFHLFTKHLLAYAKLISWRILKKFVMVADLRERR